MVRLKMGYLHWESSSNYNSFKSGSWSAPLNAQVICFSYFKLKGSLYLTVHIPATRKVQRNAMELGVVIKFWVSCSKM